jgi:hypothetical protein
LYRKHHGTQKRAPACDAQALGIARLHESVGLQGCAAIAHKCVLKVTQDTKDNIKRYKALLEAPGFSHQHAQDDKTP